MIWTTGIDVELKSGQIVDATFVTVPIQRNSREENALIRCGAVPIEWGNNPHKLAQKDTDARWTKKNGLSIYGYKDHVNADRDTKLITAWEDTPAQVHDSQALEAVLRSPIDGGAEIHADSAYRSMEQETRLEEAGAHQLHPREGNAQPAADGRTESVQPREIQDARAGGTCLWGDDQRHGWHLHPHHRKRSGARADWLAEPDIQHQACCGADPQKALGLRQGYCACCKLKRDEKLEIANKIERKPNGLADFNLPLNAPNITHNKF